jgi:hypothetical protein
MIYTAIEPVPANKLVTGDKYMARIQLCTPDDASHVRAGATLVMQIAHICKPLNATHNLSLQKSTIYTPIKRQKKFVFNKIDNKFVL